MHTIMIGFERKYDAYRVHFLRFLCCRSNQNIYATGRKKNNLLFGRGYYYELFCKVSALLTIQLLRS